MPRPTLHAPAAALALALLVPAPAAAQPAVESPSPRPSLAAQSDAAFLRGNPAEALRLVEETLDRGSGDYALLWRAARAALALGVQAEDTPAVRDPWVEKAIAFGEAAVRAQPEALEGRYWRVAAKGRMALHVGARRTVSLAREVLAEASAILADDPAHAGAHNAVGRLNLEVMTLPGWKRALAKLLAGSDLRRTSWELAELHLGRAAELDPDSPLYLRDLGALHRARRRPLEAREALGRAVDLPARGPLEGVFREEARALLSQVVAEADGAGGERLR